ncbi:hypothetical protein [Arenimonas metalli]|uniref:Uncharacterized protein n=1 Tax=Arenimonas metalli CF5-1 TaxID=1384056 RepID=A0A091B101_9GAMM|nr:hypothetical protein [Arenimonas metalli]KFN45247.1 hypothetical protein N787_13335 [Arenimonas metalli CF5-1]
MTTAPAELLALEGRRLDELTVSERAVFQRYRDARPRAGLPWVSVGLSTDPLPPTALLSASSQTEADDLLRQAGAVVCVREYPAAP